MRNNDLARIRLLALCQIATTIVAVVALVFALLAFEAKTQTIQTSRRDGREDLCHVIRNLALALTPPPNLGEIRAYLQHSPLADCVAFGNDLSGKEPRR